MEIDASSAFFPVVGVGAAFLVTMVGTRKGQRDWGEVTGFSLGLGLIIFTPALWILASILG